MSIKISIRICVPLVLVLAIGFHGLAHAVEKETEGPETVVNRLAASAMKKFSIPGMAVGVTLRGETHIFNYGIASVKTQIPVKDSTLFEIGSISKTLTATLAAYAEAGGKLDLSASVGKYLPELLGTDFGKVDLVHLGTHTPGGLPLQLPARVTNDEELIAYLQSWKPAYAMGSYRTYANPGIGMLGFITAKSMGGDFTFLMENVLLPALGMQNTFINVPEARAGDYAQGYSPDSASVRLRKAVLSPEAYGVKSTAADLLRFLEINMERTRLEEPFQKAVTRTHTGYFSAGEMIQALIWEEYHWPVSIEALLKGSSPDMVLKPVQVKK